MERKDVIDDEQKLARITSRSELFNESVASMKKATGVDEDVCIAQLENNRYDLKASIAASRR